ncbi:MAG: hypothetical protein JWN93_880 [Hyphomicrobiales bacterium]|nr:hypothetical protein [Hyphomicrobiales bacterium]
MTPFGAVLLAAGLMVLVWLCDVAASAARGHGCDRQDGAWRQAAAAAVLLGACWLLESPGAAPRLVFMLRLLTVLAAALALAQWRVRKIQARRGA